MAPQQLEQHLRDLDRIAVPWRRRAGHEVWRFAVDGEAYLLLFFPTAGRLSRGKATRAFSGLQALQKAKIPALRAVALLSGLRFGERTGDGVLAVDVPGARWLDEIAPADAAARRAMLDWLAAVTENANDRPRAQRFGHDDLRPDAFLFDGQRVLLADAVGLNRDGIGRPELAHFAHAAGELASRADRVRGWRRLVDAGGEPPAERRAALRYARELRRQKMPTLRIGEWHCRYDPGGGRPLEWSAAARLWASAADWQREWPRLVGLLRGDQLDVLKRDLSGDVMAAQITLAGVPVDVVLKRPRNKFWYRYVLDAFRRSRAWRTWQKTRRLRVRQLPVEFPLAVFERAVGGYVVAAIAVFEQVPGVTLEAADLDAMPAAARETFFRRCGRILRRIEDTGLAHPDAKSSNWIVFDSPAHGPMPILIDAYGVRKLTRFLQLSGIQRLLRAMRKHPQYRPEDSLHLCLGFAPRVLPEPADAD